MSQEIFEVWFNSSPRVCPNGSDAIASPADCSCASVIRRYAIDQQGVDFRGSVSADTAWDLWCRAPKWLQPYLMQPGLLGVEAV